MNYITIRAAGTLGLLLATSCASMALHKLEGFVTNLPRTARPAGIAANERAAAIAIANSYFVGIDKSNGKLVQEHPECYRIENDTHMVGRMPGEPPHTATRA